MNIIIKRSLFALACSLLVAGCNSGGDDKAATASAADGDAVATVNGQPISQELFEAYVQRRTGGNEVDPAMREQVINELVNIELLVQKAKDMGLHEEPETRARLAFERSSILANAAMSDYLEQNPITEEVLREEYEARKGEMGGSEYKARHILVEDRETAEKMIAELDGGADFVALAKENSTEPGASESGGDLGWFQPNQMVGPFSNAVQAMQPGNYSSEPVETQFGWHVILLEDSRQIEPPAFEDVAQRIERFMTTQRVQSYINELRGNAEVNIQGASTDAGTEAEENEADETESAAE